MRRVLSVAGAVLCIAALVVLGVNGWGESWAVWVLAILAVVNIVDAAVITRRIGSQHRDR